MEPYFAIALVVGIISWVVLSFHCYNEYDAPQPIAFTTVFMGLLGGVTFGLIWPITSFVALVWVSIRVLRKIWKRS